MLAAQLFDDGIDLVFGYLCLFRGEFNAMIVAELNGGLKRHHRGKDHRLGLNDFNLGVGDSLDLLFFQRLLIDFGKQIVQGVFKEAFLANIALQHRPRCFPLAKAGDIGSLDQAAVGLLQ